jgi:hypothetical protein
MLLDAIGVPAPMDLYGQVPAAGPERFSGLIRRNDDLAARICEKNAVVTLLKRSLQAVNQLSKMQHQRPRQPLAVLVALRTGPPCGTLQNHANEVTRLSY